MKLLVVGHIFTISYYQKKYIALKEVEPSLCLRILGPAKVRHPFKTYHHEVYEGLRPGEAIPLPAVLSKSHMVYLLDPVRMAQILRDFRPEVIHIEEEPQALITVETVTLRDLFAPRAAITIFTWDNLLRRRKFPLNAIKKAMRTYSLRRARAVICGNSEAEQLLRTQTHYEGSTTVLPQCGLDPADHFPGSEPLLKEQLGLGDAICVGYAGRLVQEKGIRLLLDALAALPQYPWKLLLVGSGGLESEIRDDSLSRFPGKIVLVPAVAQKDVPRYLRCMDIFVLASYATEKWKEQFGLALAQAMMVGVAPIGSSSGAIPEVVGPGGLIFEEGNVKSLTRALECLLASPARRVELSRRARDFALRNYASRVIAARYLSVFEQARSLAVPWQEKETRTPGGFVRRAL